MIVIDYHADQIENDKDIQNGAIDDEFRATHLVFSLSVLPTKYPMPKIMSVRMLVANHCHMGYLMPAVSRTVRSANPMMNNSRK